MAMKDASIHPALAVTDVTRARAWYAQKLGWQPVFESPGQAIFKIGDSYFSLFETPNAGTAKNTVMNWNVHGLEAEVARLRRNGVTFEEYDFGEYKTVDGIMADPGGGKTAWFKDPDGNTIALLEAPPGQGSTHDLSVMLAAADLDRAKKFYAEKLGFRPVAEFGGFVADYTARDTSFNVYKTDFAGSARNTVAVWRVEGIVDEVGRLRDRGVTFDEYPPDPGEHYEDGVLYDEKGPINAWFTDSEGNIMALSEDRGEVPV